MISDEHLDFVHALWMRRTPFTIIFLVVNILAFVAMEFAGGTTNEATLLAFGVKSNPHIDQGEWWRLITPIFIHIGLLHLLFNSYALWIVGQQVEKLYGSARFVVFYISTGFAGVLASYFFYPETPSAGASGAIFGLFGVLLVFGIKYRKTLPPFFRRAVGTGVLPVIIINLIIGFTIPAIDNSAHIGGLVAGAALAAFIPFEKPGTRTPRLFMTAQTAFIFLTVLSFYHVMINYDGPDLSFRSLAGGWGQLFGTRSTIADFIDTINSTERSFNDSALEIRAGQAAKLAEIRVQTADTLDKLKNVPSLGARPDALTRQMQELMMDQYELIVDIERAGTVTFAHHRRNQANEERHRQIMDGFFEWVDTDGAKYGIEMGKKR